MRHCRWTGGKRGEKDDELKTKSVKEGETMLTIVNFVLAAACLARAIPRD